MFCPCFRNSTIPPNASTAWTDDPATWGTSCMRGEDFDIDVGTFMVIGPSPVSQQITCVAGWTCPLEITGTGIREVDRVMILETCGVASSVEGLPDTPSTSVMRAPGGTYQLCWCATSGLFSCSLPVEFTFGFGQLHMLGPVRGQERTCMAGQICALDILGLGLSDGDRFLVLETCGALTTLPRFPSSGLSAPLVMPTNSSTTFSEQSTRISWGTEAVTVQGGDYRICWCSSPASQVSNRSCSLQPVLVNTMANASRAEWLASSSHGFLFDAGRLRIRGVSPLEQARTCISGQVCQIHGITGMDLSPADSVMVLETCGLDHAISRFAWAGRATNVAASGATFSWGAEPVTAPGGIFRLCWCAASTNSCKIPSNFVVDFGSLTLLGSEPKYLRYSRTCVSGTTCRLHQIEGQELPMGSQLLILDSCGAASQVPRIPAIPIPADDSNYTFTSLELGFLTAAAGEYRLCWCGGQNGCVGAEQFQFDAGSFTLLGPRPLEQHRTCVSGQPCTIEGLTGIGLPDRRGGTFSILETCGAAPWKPSFPPVPDSQCRLMCFASPSRLLSCELNPRCIFVSEGATKSLQPGRPIIVCLVWT